MFGLDEGLKVYLHRDPATPAQHQWPVGAGAAGTRTGSFAACVYLSPQQGAPEYALLGSREDLHSTSCRFPRGCSPEAFGEDGGSHAKPSTPNNLG